MRQRAALDCLSGRQVGAPGGAPVSTSGGWSARIELSGGRRCDGRRCARWRQLNCYGSANQMNAWRKQHGIRCYRTHEILVTAASGTLTKCAFSKLPMRAYRCDHLALLGCAASDDRRPCRLDRRRREDSRARQQEHSAQAGPGRQQGAPPERGRVLHRNLIALHRGPISHPRNVMLLRVAVTSVVLRRHAAIVAPGEDMQDQNVASLARRRTRNSVHGD